MDGRTCLPKYKRVYKDMRNFNREDKRVLHAAIKFIDKIQILKIKL